MWRRIGQLKKAPFSFVIPVLNEAGNLGYTLAILKSRFPNSETIVVDGGSSDGTNEIAKRDCDIFLESSPGRATQMNLGASRAQGEVLFFLHADTVPDFSEAEFSDQLSLSTIWGFCRVKLSGEKIIYKVISSLINKRSEITYVSTGDQMIFIRRAVFDALGGYGNISLMEDIYLSKQLRVISKPQVMSLEVVTSSRRWEENGVIKTIALMWTLRAAYFCGVPPNFLKKYY